MNDTASHQWRSAGYRPWFTLGMLSLALTIINAAVFAWILAVAGTGVDPGLSAFAGIVTITVPLGAAATAIGVVAVVRKSGQVLGWIAVGAAAAAILLSVWGFVSTQML
jgi:hypothetical protein